MKIETKYNIGDEVWFLGYHNCKRKGVVFHIYVTVENGQINTFYCVNNKWQMGYSESSLFPTKEELLKSL